MKNSIHIVTLLSLCILSTITLAQNKDTLVRKGFTFGLSSGAAYSNINFPNKTTKAFDFALDAKVGYMLKPYLAMLVSTNVSAYNYVGFGRSRKRDFGVLAVGMQYWIKPKLWLLAGVGLGGDNPVFFDIKNPDTDPLETKYYNGIGLVAAVGYEIYQCNNFAIDVKTKLAFRDVKMLEGSTNGWSFAILLGCNLY